MKRTILFHIPKPLEAGSAHGSKLRPFRLVDAFRSLNYDVEVVAGTALVRKKKMQEVLRNIRNGKHYDFLYSESSNAPIPVSDNHHIPLAPFADYLFFRELKKSGIRTGVYYRDVFWKFPLFREKLSLPLRLLVMPLHKLDWYAYSKYMDHLFLPSDRMRNFLHTSWPEDRVSELPPGCVITECDSKDKSSTDPLTCFYVGGIEPPVYDLKAMLEICSGMHGLRLVICCRRDEWQKYKNYYGNNYTNIEIVHKTSEDIMQYFCNSDLFLCVWGRDPYLEIAMPIKIFEALGYALPVIITDGSEAARFISGNNTGWVVKDAGELGGLLNYLNENRNEISLKRSIARQLRQGHTWIQRAKQIAETLSPEK